jgi:FtsP/CotA-like multicopper oxidase with cupredoxin domain
MRNENRVLNNKWSRRQFLQTAGVGAAAFGAAAYGIGGTSYAVPIQGGTLDPTTIPKYVEALVIPPVMPMNSKKGGVDYYEIAVREFDQQILPTGMPLTTVWSYGSVDYPGSVFEGGSFFYPALTIEAKYNKPVRVKWINDLVDEHGNYLPHLLAVDQTLHWANPPGPIDTRGTEQDPYTGPVPIVTHVHGAHVTQESDGYPEAWYLPDANNIPAGYATVGSFYDQYAGEFYNEYGVDWEPGTSVFQYPNDQRATTLWYHDHSLGMTRLNVYAGPAGFYIIRGGPDDEVTGILPGPAPKATDKGAKKYYEIPIAIQDRSFNADGSLFYPDNRAFFEGLEPNQLKIPFIPEKACDGTSDVSPIWNPEFFGNTMVVNGRSWPYLEVEPRRYRIRFLNGCNSRFLILKMSNDMPIYQIGAEGGFLPDEPVMLDEMLMAPAERADVIVDFTDYEVGTEITLLNFGPDEPYGGGTPGVDFDPADPGTTGQVMKFKVVALTGSDPSTDPESLELPEIIDLEHTNSRQLSLNEEESATVRFREHKGIIMKHCGKKGEVFGPTSALLGTLDGTNPVPLLWMDPITEEPVKGTTEMWEIYNFTADAHPIHVHLVMFQVIGREQIGGGPSIAGSNDPLPWETGWKDTVISYPGEITRIKARFDYAGLYVWHCHIVEHEDNEMMRPYQVVEP